MKNGNTAPGPNTTELADDAYRLAGIFPTAAPGDNVGRDWLTYRIAQRITVRAQSGEDNALDVIWVWRLQETPADAGMRKSTVVPP